MKLLQYHKPLHNSAAEKTISKLVERIATLKGVTQPYSSFDGVPKEIDYSKNVASL